MCGTGVTMEDIIRRYVRELEQLQRAVERSARPSLGHCLLIDMNGTTVFKFLSAYRLWLEVALVGARFYPELMGTCILVRGPPAAAWAVRTMKRVLEPATAAKLELFSGPPAAALRPFLDPLPPELCD